MTPNPVLPPTKYPIWVTPHAHKLHLANHLALLLPHYSTQSARITDGKITAICERGTNTLTVGKTVLIRGPGKHSGVVRYLARIHCIYRITDIESLTKKQARWCGFATATQCITNYSAQYGEEALEAQAWLIIVQHVRAEKGKPPPIMANS